ncbi:flagellar export chaperone FliS [Ammoniphilus sp. 3BR4]|uniref:flagellar export chaperone FliS n=1 Tax=Ammoniphilus sp. 3BR4 TaxID=3158265 RepID=UPI003465CB7E
MSKTVDFEQLEYQDIVGRPVLITSLLYKKLLQQLELSIQKIQEKRLDDANYHLQLSQDIVERLGFGIKYEGGIIADQLELIYHYVSDRILQANLKKDSQIILEIRNIVSQLDEGWTQAMEKEEKACQPVNLASSRMNPYQRRELEQEKLDYEIEKHK